MIDRQMTDSVGLSVAFSAGLFSFLSPCVLPLFPSYLSFITGMSVDRLSGEVTAGTRGGTCCCTRSPSSSGFTAVFVRLGVSVSAAGQFLLDYRDWIRIGGGVLIIVFGLYIAGILRVGLFGRSAQIQIRTEARRLHRLVRGGADLRHRLDAVRGPHPGLDPHPRQQ